MSQSSHVFVFRVALAPFFLLYGSLVVSYNMLASFVETQAARCSSFALAIAGHYSYLYSRFWLRACLSLMRFVEDAVTRIFEWESRALSLPACGVHVPQESAVVIIGGEAGLGRAISLSLSELGYTIFALCPNSNGTCESRDSATKSSAVSSLLYAWHKRKERSIHTSWGLIAPISCDMSESGVKRTHAFETVHAYCDKHLLKLTALIVLSPSSLTRRQEFRHRSSYWRAQSQLLGVRPFALWSSGDDLTMLETTNIVEDYVEMLSKASGRVILLSHEERECYFCRPVAVFRGVSKQVARNLNDYLENLGIKAISVNVGPVAASVEEDANETRFGGTMQNSASIPCFKLHAAISDLLNSSALEYDLLCKHILQVMTTRYPRYSYSMGIYPILDAIRFSMPDVLHQLLHYFFR